MKKNKWIVIVSSVVLAACGNDETKSTYNESDTTNTVVTEPSTSQSTSTTTYVVPDVLQTNFKTQYPTATSVQWAPYQPYDKINWEWTGWPSMDSTYYAVSYTIDDKNYVGWWDKNSNWIGSSVNLRDSSLLPDPVKKAIKSNFPGYTITSIDEENDKNRTAYEIKLEKGDARVNALIDKNGKVLKKSSK
jgi:hypothetical protein